MRGLEDKVVVVTGAARGIGQASAVRFGEEGATVIAADVHEAKETVDLVNAAGARAESVQMDVRNLASVCKALGAVLERHGRIDVLINNAGILRDAMMKRMTPEDLEAVLSVNLTGVWNCTSAALPGMLERRSGVVLTTSSIVGLMGNVGQANYAASKWGVIGMTKCWAKEMAKDGLRFNCVAPGVIATDMARQIPEKVLAEKLLPKIPAGRLGLPEEIAAAFAFLASDDAKYINGTVLSVDGACSL